MKIHLAIVLKWEKAIAIILKFRFTKSNKKSNYCENMQFFSL